MIDCSLYRETENIARRCVNKWQIAARYNIDIFEKMGFPVRVNSIADLRQLFDTMNEGQFDYFMKEIDGLNSEEFSLLLDIINETIYFQQLNFPNSDVIIPLDNLMKCMVLFIKLQNLQFNNILEIGSGSGILSFFISRKKDLNMYTQIEVCESFYMLQHYINTFVFKEMFDQKVLMRMHPEIDFFIKDYNGYNKIKVNAQKKTCEQYPWWRLGELAKNDISYDVVLSNANLLEFSKEVLIDYLELINLKLSAEGLFIFHCEGEHVNGDVSSLFKDLYKMNYAPLFIHMSSEQIIEQMDDCNNLEDLILAPASESVMMLLKNKEFTSKFRNIYILDDFKYNTEINGYRILSRSEIIKSGIKKGIILNHNIELENDLMKFFDENSINNILKKKKFVTKSFGIFINNKHKLFKKYYDKSNFRKYFNSNEDIVKKFFFRSSKTRYKYSKHDIFNKINAESR